MADAQPTDAQAIALLALATAVSDERRARRFLDLTGIGTGELREKVGEPELLSALLVFLEAHEPDLLSVSEQIGIQPDMLVAARRALEGEERR
jgi:hypothetical protein